MEPGLAATSAGVTNKYGDGSGNIVSHYYAGAGISKQTKKKKKSEIKGK